MDNLLTKAVSEVISSEHLERQLKSGKKLRVKLGIDPTSPELHLGHLVPLLKLKQFQDAGHKAVLIIGDFTAMIGDPSGRSETRKPLTEAQIKNNFKTYLKQAEKVLDIKKIEVRYNSEWYKKGGLNLLLELSAKVTVPQVLKRDDFDKRLKEGDDLSVLEILYPILQGYDSVAVKADLEIGGTDQKFNLLMGRRLQRIYGYAEQDVMMLPLLIGTDGIRKMSKSYGNFIALADKPEEVFGKIMSIPDNLMVNYFDIFTVGTMSENLSPYESKQILASEIVKLLHGEKFAEKAKDNFQKVFSKKEVPEDVPTIGLEVDEIDIISLLILAGVSSKGEARRLITQKAVDVGSNTITNPNEIINTEEPAILKVGKKRFFRVVHL
ncbi:MAG: tyrosine--tRNA ligase [bacterium]|nr:tyrosine--tRNA ligase [bacterium]